jgi:hypothetical protein
MATHSPLAFHIAFFSFDNNSTVKGHPEAKTCYRIAEEICKD